MNPLFEMVLMPGVKLTAYSDGKTFEGWLNHTKITARGISGLMRQAYQIMRSLYGC